MEVDQIMTIEEVAKMLRLSPSTIYRMANWGVIPAFKAGGRWRFVRAEIIKWIEAQHAGSK